MPTKLGMEMTDRGVDTLETGLRSTLRIVLDPALAGVTGRYFERTGEARAHPDAYRLEVRERLWAMSERLTAR
jgi:hypothetical protein